MHKDELMKTLSEVEGNPEIYMDVRVTNFKYGLVNTAKVKKIRFSEQPDSEVLAEDHVIVISEE